MINAAVFARDVAYCAFCFTGDDLGLIADTGQVLYAISMAGSGFFVLTPGST